MTSPIREPISRWYHFFDGMKFSSREFYASVEENLKKRETPNTKIERVKFSESLTLIYKRIYLRIKTPDYVFDICAAPYGSGFFVSWWFGETYSWFYQFMIRIPLLGPLIDFVFKPRTYYILDSASMFQECVRISVLEAIDAVSKEQGIRLLTESEREPSLPPLQKR